MRKNGHNWKLFPLPTRSELYPNMKNEIDFVTVASTGNATVSYTHLTLPTKA